MTINAIPPHAARLRLGFVPLTTAAPLLVARDKGFFGRHGLAVELMPLGSWAALRDRVCLGDLDGGLMLSPMPLAAGLGIDGAAANDSPLPLVVTATIGLNDNTITLGDRLMADIAAASDEAAIWPLPVSALAAALAHRRAAGRPPPILAVVFAFSSHNYLLRYWLASGGIDPDRDIRLVVVPPPLVAAALQAGQIDGFCAGEPWGSCAVAGGSGRIVLTSADIWRNHPEKVLAFAERIATGRPDHVAAAVAAVIEAARWLDRPENRDEAARILIASALPYQSADQVKGALEGRIARRHGEAPVAVAPTIFHAGAATFPFRSHALWWLAQMRRWGHAPPGADPAIARRIWRPDLWRRGAALVDEAMPLIDVKCEGAHATPWTMPATPRPIAMPADRFIDGAVLDPMRVPA